MIVYALAFAGGGAMTALVVYFELAGFPLLSRFAALFPVVTWLSYLILGVAPGGGGELISRHALFVLIGSLVSWVPYMLIIYYFAPKIGPVHAVALAIGVFVLLALLFSFVYKG